MFKNPLKKYQTGGQLNLEQQQMLAAFIEWLPKRVKEFQGMKPEAIAQALDGMSKTPEGQKQVQKLMQQFQQESQQSVAPTFKQGGKIRDFICKHAKGGTVDCGCGGTKIRSGQEGGNSVFKTIARTTPIGRFVFPTNPLIIAQRNAQRVPDLENITDRKIGFATDDTGKKVLYEDAVINGNSADTFVEIPQPGDTIVRQNVLTRHGIDNRVYPVGSDEYNSILNRSREFLPSEQKGGEIVSIQKAPEKVVKYISRLMEYPDHTVIEEQAWPVVRNITSKYQILNLRKEAENFHIRDRLLCISAGK